MQKEEAERNYFALFRALTDIINDLEPAIKQRGKTFAAAKRRASLMRRVLYKRT